MSTHERVCLHCKEPIHPEARRCPSCLGWQSRWAGDAGNPRLELLIGAVGLVLIIVLAVVWISLDRDSDDKAGARSNPARALQATVLSFEAEGPEERSYLVITGEMSNQGEVAWIHPLVQVALYDENDQRIAVFTTRIYALVVPPHETAPFRIVDSVAATQAGSCARCEVQVRWADAIKEY